MPVMFYHSEVIHRHATSSELRDTLVYRRQFFLLKYKKKTRDQNTIYHEKNCCEIVWNFLSPTNSDWEGGISPTRGNLFWALELLKMDGCLCPKTSVKHKNKFTDSPPRSSSISFKKFLHYNCVFIRFSM